MPFFQGVGDGRVYYRRWDAPQPKGAVLLLHGFGVHTGYYHRLGCRLSWSGLDVWALDHVGHGRTEGDRGMFATVRELADNAAMLLEIIRSEHSEVPILVVGHSLGGLTGALLVIADDQLRAGLIMTGTPLWGLPEEVVGRTDLIMATDRSYLGELRYDPLGFDTGPVEPSLRRALPPAGLSIRSQLPHIDVPVMLINGEFDVFANPTNAREFASTLRSGRSVTIPGSDYDIPDDIAHRYVVDLITTTITEWCLAAMSAR
ncbi:alpha/beta hydrolase [Nocardia salmonicida]